MSNNNINHDKIFIEKNEKVRLIIQQGIGIGKVLEVLREKYKVRIFKDNYNKLKIILIEEKNNEYNREI